VRGAEPRRCLAGGERRRFQGLRGEYAGRAGRPRPGAGPAAARGRRPAAVRLTHGHPTALAASDLTAHAVWLLAQGAGPAELPRLLREYARQYARQSRFVYRADWLGDLAERARDPDRGSFTARGWDECLAALDRLDAALAAADPEADPCLAVGAGWIAEEALATGLYCFLMLPEDPQAVVRRAAYSSGDSDSIAALAGAFAGAYHGVGAWPAEWVRDIEYRDRLLALGTAWDG
jgi:ADP-ribosylglycohydrolase